IPSPPRPDVTRISVSSMNMASAGGRRASALRRRRLVDVHAAARAVAHDAVLQRVEREVAPLPHVVARMEVAAALAHQDGARRHELPAEALEPAVLRVAVAPVARAALSLLVCHVNVPACPRWRRWSAACTAGGARRAGGSPCGAETSRRRAWGPSRAPRPWP